MNEMYARVIKEIDEETTKQMELISRLRNLPELEGIARMHSYTAGRVIFVQPYDLEMYKRNIKILQDDGFTWDGAMQPSSQHGTIIGTFDRGNVSIHLHVEPELEGSTCKKQVIGYENTPIYEVVCMDA